MTYETVGLSFKAIKSSVGGNRPSSRIHSVQEGRTIFSVKCLLTSVVLAKFGLCHCTKTAHIARRISFLAGVVKPFKSYWSLVVRPKGSA